MNKNFVLYDNYTITFNDLKERSIIKQYYLLNEQDQILKIICASLELISILKPSLKSINITPKWQFFQNCFG